MAQFNWKEVWDRKGTLETKDLALLDGFENTTADSRQIAAQITGLLQIDPSESVLEVGCGAGMLAQHLRCKYVGIDYSENLVRKHIEILKNSVLVGEAGALPFGNKTFDKVFAFSIFQYFPSIEYAKKAIAEMERVARKAVFIGDLAESSHSKDHLLFSRELFCDFKITPGFYNPTRFNAYRHF